MMTENLIKSKARVQHHGEVFTPNWMVKKMLAEPSIKAKLNDLHATFLEPSAGEGAFLVEILNQKLDYVDKISSKTNWTVNALWALMSVYGIELLQDNLIVARSRMIEVVAKHYKKFLGKDLSHRTDFYRATNFVIKTNIVQGNSLTYKNHAKQLIQFSNWQPVDSKQVKRDTFTFKSMFDGSNDGQIDEQLDLFNLDEPVQAIEYAICPVTKIYKEKKNKMTEEKHRKFNVIIGNPPFQDETAKKETENKQKARTNIFQKFQEESDKIASDEVVLIYPGKRWIHRSGKGLKEFGLKQINDPHLASLTFYPNSKEVFDNVTINDGVSIVVKDMHKHEKGFTYTLIKNGKAESVNMPNPGDQLMPLNPSDIKIVNKIDKFVVDHHLSYLHKHVTPQKTFGIESSFAENHPDQVTLYTGQDYDKSKYIKLFTNNQASSTGRATWFIVNRNVIKKNISLIDKYKVVVSSVNPGGQRRDNQLEIMPAGTAFGRARVALRSFDTLKEAENFKKYVASYFIRYTFLMTDEALSSVAKRVPDLNDYSDNNQYLDFSKAIDPQLTELMNISAEEFRYMKEKVINFRKGDKK